MSYTREQLRAVILQQDDDLRNSWLIWSRMSQVQKNLTLAGRQCISKDVANTNNYLDDLNSVLNTMQSHTYGEGYYAPSLNDVIEAVQVLVSTFVAWISKAFKW